MASEPEADNIYIYIYIQTCVGIIVVMIGLVDQGRDNIGSVGRDARRSAGAVELFIFAVLHQKFVVWTPFLLAPFQYFWPPL